MAMLWGRASPRSLPPGREIGTRGRDVSPGPDPDHRDTQAAPAGRFGSRSGRAETSAGGEEHFGQKKEQSWAHVSQHPEHRSPWPRAPSRCPAGLRGGSSPREITHPTEQLFLSPAKAPLCRPEPSGCLRGGEAGTSAEPCSSIFPFSTGGITFPPANLPGGHRVGLRAGRRSPRVSGAKGQAP